MARLTVKSTACKGHYILKCLCRKDDDKSIVEGECATYCNMCGLCDDCGIQQAFDKLAAYEGTGLDPEQINALIEEEALLKLKTF